MHQELVDFERKKDYDAFSLDIEFLLISVVQGVAIAALATAGVDVIGNFTFEYWLYIASAFILILAFWSQAIIHTISFIDWPLNLSHNFLYFFVSFIEVIAFSHITSPFKWFVFMTLFFIAAGLLYFLDLRLIRAHKKVFEDTKEQKEVYKHILKRQLFEFRFFLPLAIISNAFAALLIYLFPVVFIKNHWHILLIFVQTMFGLFVLFDSIKSFKTRTMLINKFILAKKYI